MSKKEIYIGSKKIEVSKEFYKEYIKLQRHSKYINKKEEQKKLFYYNSIRYRRSVGKRNNIKSK